MQLTPEAGLAICRDAPLSILTIASVRGVKPAIAPPVPPGGGACHPGQMLDRGRQASQGVNVSKQHSNRSRKSGEEIALEQIPWLLHLDSLRPWIPAFAGMTGVFPARPLCVPNAIALERNTKRVLPGRERVL